MTSREQILQLGLGFWSAKVLLVAVELGVFTELAVQPLAAETLRVKLGLHDRSTRDFFDALVALKLLVEDAMQDPCEGSGWRRGAVG
ncbi:MAG: methyltransferase family protein [Pseudonocardiaceae bacterium]